MSWADDYLKSQQGAQQSNVAAGQPADGGLPGDQYVSGFLGSALSAIPELFGEKPTPAAQQFRAANPWSGIASQLVGGVVPYAAVGELSTIGKGAQILGEAMDAIPGVRALTAVDNPILHAAAKEVVRYSPVELARLGVGLGTTDNWHDYGNLFADVGLSTLITGGFGGIGGLFRVGGKALPEMASVEGAPVGLRPTFEYRMSLSPGAASNAKGLSITDVQNDLFKQVFTETPGKTAVPGMKESYVSGLEGGNPETDALVSTLFRPATGQKAAVQRLPLMDQAGNWNINDDQMKTLLGGLSARSNGEISTVEDLAQNVVFPRLVTVNSARAAGTVSKALDDSAMQWVADGVMAGKESQGGLHVMAVRLKAPDAPILAENGAFLTDPNGQTQTFYHGTARPYEGLPDPSQNAIPRGMTVYSTSPDVASTYAKYGSATANDAQRVFPVNIKSEGIADFRNPEHVQKAADWYNKEHARLEEKFPNQLIQPPSIDNLAAGDWGMWENPEMLKANGWKGAYVSEPIKGGGTALNLAVMDPKAAVSIFDRTKPPPISAGDQWLLFKTDKPQLFAPEGYKLAQANVDAWAQFRNAWRPSGMDDFASKDMDQNVQLFTPQDYMDRVNLPPATAKAAIAKRLANKFSETAGLDNSATIRNLVDNFFDVMAPTVVNERRNPLFARLFGTLRSAMNAGDSIVNRAVGGTVKVKGGIWTRKNLEHGEGLIPGSEPIAQSIGRLTPDEREALQRISDAQAPADQLAEYTNNGLVSDNLRKAIDNIQAHDRFLWENHLMPAFKNAQLDGKFDLLEGYIMPRMWTGDWFAPVTDEYGNLQWLANGTRGQAMSHAKVVVDEANKLGKKLKIEQPYMLGAGKPADQIGDLHDLVQMQIGKDADMQQIVQRAMKRIAIESSGNRKPLGTLPKGSGLSTVMTERTGIGGSPDLRVPTAEDQIKSIDNHYKQLTRFAAYSTWRNRFLQEAWNLNKQSPTLFKDLMRKSNQLMGYEGQITNTLNKALQPILGHWLGGKPATRIAVATNGLLYDWNLAIVNPTFSLLNVLQPIQTVLPHLSFILSAMKNGMSDLVENDMHMTMRYGADGKPREVIGVLSPAKIMGRALKLMGDPDEELKAHLSRAKTEGTLNAQLFEGWYGGQSKGLETIGDAYRNAGGGANGSWEAMKRIATFTAERSEEVSRGIAFNSYYILGKDYLGLEGDQLYRFMKRGTHNSMFGYSLIDRSRIFTGPVGSMFGLFKNWQMHFIASMFQYAKLGWDKGAWGPLLWQFGVAGAMGGLGAMGPLKWVADGLANWNDKSPNSYLWMQEHWHDSADELYFGLPALFGATLQASSTLPGTDVRNDLSSLSSFVFAERAKAAGKAVGAAWDYATANGQDPLRVPAIRDQLMQAFAPRAVFRAFASVDGDYIKSMSSGYPQVRGVSPLSKFFYGAGLNQVEVERQQVAGRELWNDQQARMATIQQLGVALADAQLNGDYDEMERIQQTAMLRGLPVSSVYKSARTRLRRQTQSDSLTQYRGDLANRYKQAWNGQ